MNPAPCRLIVVACLVEVGEVVARLIVHATMSDSASPSELLDRVSSSISVATPTQVPLSRDEAFSVFDGMIRKAAP